MLGKLAVLCTQLHCMSVLPHSNIHQPGIHQSITMVPSVVLLQGKAAGLRWC